MTSIEVMTKWSRSLGSDVTWEITSLSIEVTVTSPIDKQMVRAYIGFVYLLCCFSCNGFLRRVRIDSIEALFIDSVELNPSKVKPQTRNINIDSKYFFHSSTMNLVDSGKNCTYKLQRIQC